MHDYMRVPTRPVRDPLAKAVLRAWRQQTTVARRLEARAALQAKGENKVAWSGVLCTLDSPSVNPPQGSSGHRIIVPRSLAQKTSHQLRHMPVNTAVGFDAHDKQNVVGTLIGATVQGNVLHVHGYLYNKNRPGIIQHLRDNQGMLGLSFEVSDVAVQSAHDSIWTLTHLEWTGCSILAKKAAAFPSSSFHIGA